VDVDVIRPNVYAVKTAMVTTADKHVVNFAAAAGIHAEVEGRGIDEFDIMDREVFLYPITSVNVPRGHTSEVDYAAGPDSPRRRISATVARRDSLSCAFHSLHLGLHRLRLN